MSEYTKGEWSASDGGKSNYVASVTAKSARGKAFNVALCARPMHGCAVANARLISAAPELLEALEIVLDSLGALTKQHELLDRMDESEANKVWVALHKATGRPMP